MKLRIFFLAALLSVCLTGAHKNGDAQELPVAEPPVVEPAPVVLELFTSQGCAFCPPADQLMGQMIQQKGVIGLSCHVDYFDVHKDSLGKSFCTARQSNYNRLIGKGPRYTPQLIVNGHMDMIGYEAGRISTAILRARSEAILPIKITAENPDSFTIALPKLTTKNENFQLWLAVFDSTRTVTIAEGSNLGKKLTYYNVVRDLKDLGTWDGSPQERLISAGTDYNGISLIAQSTKTGRILAAGSALKKIGETKTP